MSVSRSRPDVHMYRDFPVCLLQQVRLHFLSYTFKNTSDCEYKSINVYDGSDNMAPLLHSYCDGVWPGDVISRGSTVFVTYAPRVSEAESTFRIKYSATAFNEGVIHLSKISVSVKHNV